MSDNNKVLTELIHKPLSEQSDIEKALMILWSDVNGYEFIAIAAMEENAAIVAERDALKAAVEQMRLEAEYHRNDYDKRAQLTDSTRMDGYWKGRRDEAGHFRDRLAKLEAAK